MKSEALESTLKEATARLTAEFAPEQVWLFGSHAWGEPDEHSDLDFLVIIPESDEPVTHRMERAHECLSELNVSKDVLVETQREFDRFRGVRASLSYKIANEGRLLYGRR